MLYPAACKPGGAILWSYAPEADSVGVGITGGGVDLPDAIKADPLTWEEFTRDLRLCVMRKPIHISAWKDGAGFPGETEHLQLGSRAYPRWCQPGEGISYPAHRLYCRTLERPWVLLFGLATLIGLVSCSKQSEPPQDKC